MGYWDGKTRGCEKKVSAFASFRALKTYGAAADADAVTVTVPWRRLAAHGRVRVNLKPRRRGVVVVECSYQPIC